MWQPQHKIANITEALGLVAQGKLIEFATVNVNRSVSLVNGDVSINETTEISCKFFISAIRDGEEFWEMHIYVPGPDMQLCPDTVVQGMSLFALAKALCKAADSVDAMYVSDEEFKVLDIGECEDIHWFILGPQDTIDINYANTL